MRLASIISLTIIGIVWFAAAPSGAGDPSLDERPAAATLGSTSEVGFSEAGRVFMHLGMPEKSEAATRIEHRAVEGTMPETISVTIRSLASKAAIQNHYVERCRRLGLASPASAESRALEPDLICDGNIKGLSIFVLLDPGCDAVRCAAYLEVRGI